MKTSKLFSIIFVTLLLLTGCKTRKSTMTGSYDKSVAPCEVLKKSAAAQPAFKTMNISKMTMSLNDGRNTFTFKSSIRIASDSLISISIQPALGIEMFRLEMTPDYFTVYDKLNRRYSKNEYEYIRLRWGIDINYKVFEALLSNCLFTLQSTEPKDFCHNFRVQNVSDTTTFVSRESKLGLSQLFDISLFNNRITLVGVRHKERTILSLSYGNLRRFDHIEFPTSIILSTSITDPAVSATIDIDKISFNKPISSSNINLNRYKMVGLSDIFRL